MSNTELKDKRCPQCDCMLYTIAIGADGEPAKVECNMCGAAFPVNVPNPMTAIYETRLGECASTIAQLKIEAEHLKLSLNDAGLLGDLIRGVQAGAKLRWYQFGVRDTDHSMIFTMRAFTYNGGGFLRDEEDVRNAYVWCSDIFERWLKVSDIITALDNIEGKHGMENPMAFIEYKE